MFCQLCGENLQPDAKYCQKCGAPTSKSPLEVSGASLSPRVAGKENNAIWNPNAASNWSILFSPAFGSYLHALNWRALGEEEHAKSSMGWFYFSLVMLVVYILIGLLIKDENAYNVVARGLGLLYLIVWYFSAGKEEAKYVKEKIGSDYPRRSWGKPLIIGIAALISYFIIAFMVAFLVASVMEVIA